MQIKSTNQRITDGINRWLYREVLLLVIGVELFIIGCLSAFTHNDFEMVISWGCSVICFVFVERDCFQCFKETGGANS